MRLKLLKNKENNKKICDIFHNFKNIHYVMSEISLKRFYFALFDDGLTLKTLKLAYISFCLQTLHPFLRLIVPLFLLEFLTLKHKDSFGKSENLSKIFFAEILVFDHDYEGKSSSSNGLL